MRQRQRFLRCRIKAIFTESIQMTSDDVIAVNPITKDVKGRPYLIKSGQITKAINKIYWILCLFILAHVLYLKWTQGKRLGASLLSYCSPDPTFTLLFTWISVDSSLGTGMPLKNVVINSYITPQKSYFIVFF